MTSNKTKGILYKSISVIGILVPLALVFFNFYGYDGGTMKTSTYLLFSIVLILFSLLFRKSISYGIYILLNSLVFSFFSAFDMVYLNLYGFGINPSTIDLIMESNTNESSEYFSTYLNPKISIIMLLILFSLLLGVKFSFSHFRDIIKFGDLKKVNKYLVLISLVISTILLVKYRNNFTPYIALESAINFHLEREQIKKMEIKKNGDFKDVTHKKSDEKETYVIVIGESTTKTHLNLYGYYRQTNPLLTKRKDELLIFQNVRAPHSNTIASLGQSLILKDYDLLQEKLNNTIVQLFNSANFDTYLLSNQNPRGTYESTTSLITKSSKHTIYTSIGGANYDEVVLEPLRNILKEEKDRKFIIVHLFGTHNSYAKRYPPKFDVFKDEPKTKFKKEKAYKTINEYDNAVLYNDYIVNTIIDEVQKTNTKAYVLYFSDHGEDVFETINQACHFERNGTEPMLQVPFMIWLSEKYKNDKSNLVWDTTRPYNHKDLIHTAADLSDINFKGFEPKRSVVNPNYINNNSTK